MLHDPVRKRGRVVYPGAFSKRVQTRRLLRAKTLRPGGFPPNNSRLQWSRKRCQTRQQCFPPQKNVQEPSILAHLKRIAVLQSSVKPGCLLQSLPQPRHRILSLRFCGLCSPDASGPQHAEEVTEAERFVFGPVVLGHILVLSGTVGHTITKESVSNPTKHITTLVLDDCGNRSVKVGKYGRFLYRCTRAVRNQGHAAEI